MDYPHKVLPTYEAMVNLYAADQNPLGRAAMVAGSWLGKKRMVNALKSAGYDDYLIDAEKKTWDWLHDRLLHTQPAVQEIVVRAAVEAKAGQLAAAKARRAQKAVAVRREQRDLMKEKTQIDSGLPMTEDSPLRGERDLEALLRDPGWKFLQLPTEEERKNIYRSFRQATSNEALAMGVCVICGRELLKEEGNEHVLFDVPNIRAHLKPTKHHPSHVLWEGLLIARDHVKGEGATATGWICAECYQSLSRNSLPKFALTNNMWPGIIPHELAVLTLPEQLLIARHHPRCYIVKLFPKSGHHNPEHLQRALSGNVTLYEMNTEAVAEMVAGQKMPQNVTSLASVLAITFIGTRKLPKEWLKNTFRVRRNAVRDALLWLKAHNRLYSDIDIQEDLLRALPVDDVPVEVLTTMRQEKDDEVAERERASYVPSDQGEGRNADGLVPTGEEDEREETASRMEVDDGNASKDEDSTVGDVIPLQCLGVTDVDHSRLSLSDLMKHALANATTPGQEGGYAVRHGAPVSMFGRDKDTGKAVSRNPLAAAYPDLWPFGVGGPEDDREKTVGFQEHVRWALEYHDRRFRTHHSFPFVAFSIIQRREALNSARLQMKRRDFDREAIILSSLTASDLHVAAKEEEEGKPITNPRVLLLKKHVVATSRRVTGSNQMRASYRGQIWGTCLYLSAPSVWMTLNPSDTHDPVAQVFAGEQINMDDFHRLAGPDRDRRAKNIAKDPYAAAKFFYFIVRTVLETVFGIKVNSVGRISSEKGTMGAVSGYFGVVEAQGRGTLHVHMFLWLVDAPNCEEMLQLLRSETFRDRVRAFIKANIRAHLDAFTEEDIRNMPVDREVAYCRPADPDSADFDDELEKDERRMARAQQVHSCTWASCLRFGQHGKVTCKRRAPWPLAEKDDIDEHGNWTPKRSYPFLVNYNPAVLTTLHCNNDAKYLASGDQTSAATWYNTKYETKGQPKSSNTSALMAKALMYHELHPPNYEDILEQNRILLFRCQHLINQEMEIPGPLAIAYEMGYGDAIRSHRYVPLYWAALGRLIKKVYPEMQFSTKRAHKDQQCVDEQPPDERSAACEQDGPEGAAEPDQSGDNVDITFGPTGKLTVTSQVQDYQDRAECFENMSFLDYVVDTYEEVLPDNPPQEATDANDRARRGRPPNQRGNYLPSHPKHKTHRRVRRCRGHNILPNVVGPWFPRHNNEDERDFYCASMLALLKPWRTLQSLKPSNGTWDAAFAQFLDDASQFQRNVIAGVNYYYQCRTAAQKQAAEAMHAANGPVGIAPHHDVRMVDAAPAHEEHHGAEWDVDAADIELTEADLEAFKRTQGSLREQIHAEAAVGVGEILGVFKAPSDAKVESRNVSLAIGDDAAKLAQWKAAMASNGGGPLSLHEEGTAPNNASDTGDVSRLGDDMGESVQAMDTIAPGIEEALSAVDPSMLLKKQRQAYDMIDWHLREALAGRHPPQLLMVLLGEGGVGKSKTVQTITDNFVQLGVGHVLVKAAYTGIAASIIDGKTLHVACGIPVNGRQQSSETAKRQATFWRDKQYLIIDEMSMLSRDMLATVSGSIQQAKKAAGVESEAAFGGVNVILVGDQHQFPPVATKKSAPLFYPNCLAKDTQKQILGRQLYEEFTTVVRLKEQVRVTDPVWHDVLQHVRYGNCKKQHLDVLRSLIATDPRCPPTDYSSAPWDDAVLITPRHATRIAWNRWKTRSFCAKNKRQLLICPAVDTVKGRPLTLLERFEVAVKPKRHASREERGGLPNVVELAVGMKVMVTLNVDTDIDVANGARGVISRIVLDEREPEYDPEQPEVTLKYQPLYVVVKLNRTKVKKLEGLEENEIPIYPMQKTFSISNDEIGKQTVTRTQLPLTAAYAFTDYRSQGQTIEYVFIDLRTPPSGELTPFNAYVSLSRSHGRHKIRLLADFDDRLFTTHPSEYLRTEDARLDGLDPTWSTTLPKLLRTEKHTETSYNLKIDLLQNILFYVKPFEALWKHGTVALQRLAVRTGVFPPVYELEGVKKLEEEAVSGGTYGDVYRGEYAGEQVCIKMLRVNQKDRIEVMKEAILWGQLSHRNILPFYGLCTLDFRPCLISSWAANGNVIDYVKNNPHVNRLALDVTEGLHYLHSREIVHGDLKGCNVLVDNQGYACLADFGVSSVYDRRILDWTTQSAATSNSGTVRWQAPELFQEEARNTKQSDVYAWGCTCYEIFTSEVPYADSKVDSVITLQKMQGVLPSDPSRRTQAWVDVGLNDAIWSLLFSSWDPQPETRPTIEDVQSQIGWRLAVTDEQATSPS